MAHDRPLPVEASGPERFFSGYKPSTIMKFDTRHRFGTTNGKYQDIFGKPDGNLVYKYFLTLTAHFYGQTKAHL